MAGSERKKNNRHTDTHTQAHTEKKYKGSQCRRSGLNQRTATQRPPPRGRDLDQRGQPHPLPHYCWRQESAPTNGPPPTDTNDGLTHPSARAHNQRNNHGL